jgi:hypothetical protein
MDNVLRVGDTVLWRGGFGRDPAREALVEAIELVEEGSKLSSLGVCADCGEFLERGDR